MSDALGPLDGRYASQVSPLRAHLSETALNRARIEVEIEWFIFLGTSGILGFTLEDAETVYLRAVTAHLDAADFARLSELEAQTRHDVKAVEYFLREKVSSGPGKLPEYEELVHIFATSEDINNLAYAINIRNAVTRVWLPQAQELVSKLRELALGYADTPMLARTHGQVASPTTLGKEIGVFAHRLQRQVIRITKAQYLGKFNGATGTLGAHAVALPEVNWPELSARFIAGLGLEPNALTTQIESHDWISELLGDIARFNRIAHNLATDFWTYISLGYLKQNLAAHGNTGSSTMPHKINPIRFENAEANLEISSSLLETLSATLVTSRLQRDLTDSSTLRNIGSALGYSLLALQNLGHGLDSVSADEQKLAADLEAHWEVLAEAIQQAMRVAALNGVTSEVNPYERLKELTRGREVSAEQIRELIASLPAPVAARLGNLTPHSYIGLAGDLVRLNL